MRECDVHFFEEHLEVQIESSKTDQYWDGAVVDRSGTDYCPVAMLECYMHVANISVASPTESYLV